MPSIYLIAGLIAALTGVAHSFLGERLIFRHLRSGGLVPTLAAPPLRERHIRIPWATWHLGSVFGRAFAGILLRLAFPPAPLLSVVTAAIGLAHLGGSALVLIATPGTSSGLDRTAGGGHPCLGSRRCRLTSAPQTAGGSA